MSLTTDQVADITLETHRKLVKKGAFVNMASDLTDYIGVNEIWEHRQVQFEGGVDWTIPYMMDHNHSARAVGLYESDGSAFGDVMANGAVGPRYVNAHYVYDLREPMFQRGGTAIVNQLKIKYAGMKVAMFELMEQFLWGKPVDSTDKKTPFGLAYWVTRSATEGYNGGNPSGFSEGRAGISTSTYARYANWTAQYVAASKTDLIRKMRKFHTKSMWKSPVNHATPDVGKDGKGVYTNYRVIEPLEEAMEAQNMNLGRDIAMFNGTVMFKSRPLIYVPYLEADTTDPLFMLDWKHIGVGVQAGWENALTDPYMVPGKHTVRRVDMDISMNMICDDPRRQAVFYK